MAAEQSSQPLCTSSEATHAREPSFSRPAGNVQPYGFKRLELWEWERMGSIFREVQITPDSTSQPWPWCCCKVTFKFTGNMRSSSDDLTRNLEHGVNLLLLGGVISADARNAGSRRCPAGTAAGRRASRRQASRTSAGSALTVRKVENRYKTCQGFRATTYLAASDTKMYESAAALSRMDR